MIGDEAMQLFKSFRNRFVIGVPEDRVFLELEKLSKTSIWMYSLDWTATNTAEFKAGF